MAEAPDFSFFLNPLQASGRVLIKDVYGREVDAVASALSALLYPCRDRKRRR